MKRNLLFYLQFIPFLSWGQTWTDFTTINTTSEIQSNFANIISNNDKTWVTSIYGDGLFVFDNNNWSHYPEFDTSKVKILGLDHDDNPWFHESGYWGGLFKIVNNNIIKFDVNSIIYHSITLGKNDDSWIEGVSKIIHIKNNELEQIELPKEFNLNRRSKSIILDNNELWSFGTTSTSNDECPPIYEYEEIFLKFDGNQWTNMKDPSIFDKNIDIQGITAFKNMIWARVDKQLYSFDGTSWQLIVLDSLQDITTLSFLASKDNLWVATDIGIFKYDGSSWQLIDFDFDFSLYNRDISLFEDGDDLWIGTKSGIIIYNESNTEYFGSELDLFKCSKFIKASNGDIWFQSLKNSTSNIVKYSNKSFTKYEYVDKIKPVKFHLFDPKGDEIWILTYGQGIARYKDDQWRSYSSTGLSNNKIVDINQDTEGNMLISTINGINSYRDSWHTLLLGPKSHNHIYKDNTNKVWTYGRQLKSLDENGNLQEEELTYDNDFSSIYSIKDLFQDDNGVFWLIADAPYYYDDDDDSWVVYKPGMHGRLLTSAVKIDNLLLVGSTNYGIFLLDGQSVKWKWFDDSNHVTDLFKDSNGRIWCTRKKTYELTNECVTITLAGGISVLDGETWTYFPDIVNDAYCIMEDNLGRIWFGTSDGVFVYAFGEWHQFNEENSELIDNQVNTIFQNDNQDIWIGTNEGISKIVNPHLLSMRLVGTDKVNQPKMKIYPNPAQNFITIETPYSGNIIIVNSLGVKVYQEENFQGGNIDISHLNSVLYFIGLEINDKISYQKLIIE